MLHQIVVAAARNAPELLLAVWELKHEIRGSLRVEGKLVLWMYVFGNSFARQTD